MEKVFISFSSRDSKKIARVTERFEQEQIVYWICKKNIDPGVKYAESIVAAIKECTIFCVFLSQNSNISQHVANEINIAVMNNKTIIPVLLDDIQLSSVMEYYIASYQWLNWQDGNVLDVLVSRIKGEPVSSPQVEKAFQSASAKTAEDAFQLGKACYYGLNGVEINFEDAVYWYRKAAKAGHAGAANNLGWCYETGSGTEQSWVEAFKWYQIAAEEGSAIAEYSIGWMYERGVYVDRNGSKAFACYLEAAQMGHDISQYKVGLAYQAGTYVELNYQKANEWFQKAAEQSNVAAQYCLAENCYLGRGCERDIIKAKNIWILSAEMGYTRSCTALEEYYDIFYNSPKKSFDM